MTTDKTIRLARLIGLDHITDGHGVWRRISNLPAVPWRPYECEADLEPIEAWLAQHPENWRITPQLYPSPAMLCDAVLRAFDPQPEPTQQAPEQIGTRGPACVVRGSVLSGFTFHGPFATIDDANTWLAGTLAAQLGWCVDAIVLLEPPEPTVCHIGVDMAAPGTESVSVQYEPTERPTDMAADIRSGAVAAVYSRAVAHRRHAQRLSKLRCAAERRARRFDSTEHHEACRNDWRERAEQAEAECKRLQSYTYCAYCGEGHALDGDASRVTQHIATCKKHPMRKIETERDKLREELRFMERDRDRYERRFGDYSQKLREWQEETGCSHPTAAAEELRRLREQLADADRDECCAAYKAQQLAEIERLTDRNESLLAQVQRYSISESRLLDIIEEIAAGDTSEGAALAAERVEG